METPKSIIGRLQANGVAIFQFSIQNSSQIIHIFHNVIQEHGTENSELAIPWKKIQVMGSTLTENTTRRSRRGGGGGTEIEKRCDEIHRIDSLSLDNWNRIDWRRIWKHRQ